jgi:DNA-binding transcriptional MerR regulator
MKEKKYKSIAEVSDLLKINKHVIRYWDSKFDGISTRLSDNKRRFFNIENIKKLQELKNILYQNGRHNYSFDLAKKIVSDKSKKNEVSIIDKTEKTKFSIVKLQEISNNLKELLE